MELNKKASSRRTKATFRTSDEKVFAVGDATNKGAESQLRRSAKPTRLHTSSTDF
jgi:thioredoxin reductase